MAALFEISETELCLSGAREAVYHKDFGLPGRPRPHRAELLRQGDHLSLPPDEVLGTLTNKIVDIDERRGRLIRSAVLVSE